MNLMIKKFNLFTDFVEQQCYTKKKPEKNCSTPHHNHQLTDKKNWLSFLKQWFLSVYLYLFKVISIMHAIFLSPFMKREKSVFTTKQ